MGRGDELPEKIARMIAMPRKAAKCPASAPPKEHLFLPGFLKGTRQSVVLASHLLPDEAWAQFKRYMDNVDTRSIKEQTGDWSVHERMLEIEHAEGRLRKEERRLHFEREYERAKRKQEASTSTKRGNKLPQRIARMIATPGKGGKCPMFAPPREDLALPGVLKDTSARVVLKRDLTPDEAWEEFNGYLDGVDIHSIKMETGAWRMYERMLEVREPERWLRQAERCLSLEQDARGGRPVRRRDTHKNIR